MSDNPYQSPLSSPEPAAVGVLSGSRADLRNVAKYQKVILICILIYLLSVAAQFILPNQLRFLPLLAVVGAGLTGTVFVFLLAMKVYHPVQGILYGILTLVPCIGLLMLFVVNDKATKILKQNGIHVGLLGADLSRI
jgi:hypothetical protein